MKNIYLLLLYITTASSSFLFAQTPIAHWAKGTGGTTLTKTSITHDTQGNSYVTGSFTGTVDFDPGTSVWNLTSAGSTDIFVVKYDGFGNLVWAERIGGAGADNSADITSSSTTIYICGTFSGTVDFDPGTGINNLTANGSNTDIFMIALNTSGGGSWAKRIGGSDVESVNQILVDSGSNKIYLVGSVVGEVDLDPSPTGTLNAEFTDQAAFYLECNIGGSYIDIETISNAGVPGTCTVTGIGLVPYLNTFYMVGTFTGTIGTNGSNFLTSVGGTDIFIIGDDWEKRIGGTGQDQCTGIGVTSDPLNGYPQFIVYGNFSGTLDFDPGTGTNNITSNGGSDIYLTAFDHLGNSLWTKTIGGTADDKIQDLAVYNYNDLYLTGSFGGTVDFDPGTGVSNLTSAGSSDIFISRLTNLGALTWSKKFGGTGADVGHSLSLKTQEDIFFSGSFANTATFDSFNISSLTSNPLFVGKLGGPCIPTSYSLTETVCTPSFTLNGQTYTTTGTYTQHRTNVNGCDSTITMNLTFVDINSNVSQAGNVLNAAQAGATYQWLNCSTGSTISGATSQSYTATATGNYAVVITKSGCTETSSCIAITSVGIEENTQEMLQLFPNPSRGIVTITTASEMNNAMLKVYCITGQIIYEAENIYGNAIVLDLSIASPGVYFAELTQGGKITRKKLVKE